MAVVPVVAAKMFGGTLVLSVTNRALEKLALVVNISPPGSEGRTRVVEIGFRARVIGDGCGACRARV
jgi:hypothetical protein